jgi:hypothetical protein
MCGAPAKAIRELAGQGASPPAQRDMHLASAAKDAAIWPTARSGPQEDPEETNVVGKIVFSEGAGLPNRAQPNSEGSES